MPDTATAIQLPTIALQGRQIAPAVLQIIPRETAERFQVIAFEQTDAELSLAVVYPEQLKQGFFLALKQIGIKIGREIKLFKTDPASFKSLVSQYRQVEKLAERLPKPPVAPGSKVQVVPAPASAAPASAALTQAAKPRTPQDAPGGVRRVTIVAPPAPTPKPVPAAPVAVSTGPGGVKREITLPAIDTKGAPGDMAENWPPTAPPPPLFELGKLVAYNYLKRVSLDFARHQHLLSVDFSPPNTYWFVSDGKDKPALKEVIAFIEKSNSIKAHVIIIAEKDFADLLHYYETVAAQSEVSEIQKEQEAKAAELEQEEREIQAKLEELSAPAEPDLGPQKIAEGVVMPRVQAKIVTSEEEKNGLGGFFQKVAQNFVAQDLEHKDTDPAAVEETFEALPAPENRAKDVAAPAPLPPGVKEAALPPAPAPVTPTAAAAPATDKPLIVAPTPPAPAAAAKPASATGETSDDIGRLLDRHVETQEELRDQVKTGVIPKIVAAIVSFAIHEKASDIHLEAFEDEVRIRYRMDGQLTDIIKLPPDIHNPLVSRIKILARMRLDENRIPQDGRFDVKFNESSQVDVRVSVMPTVYGEKVVMRILDKSKGIASLENLGIEGMAYNNLTQAIQKPYGICLATGPTGSGKSTSLYAILQRIATPNVNVVTLEDPIEYEMKGINQSQIRPKIGYSFAEGLRSILRQDPNIIMVGEIRDGETATMATQAALTGHLVLSTLHTNDAAGAIPRLTNMGIEPFLITSSLNMVMAQRLVRKICPNCRHEINLPGGIRSQLEKDIAEIASINQSDAKRIKKPLTFYQGTGCAQCNGKGYIGRVGIYEVLLMTDAIGDLTLARASALDIEAQARKEGMLTLYQDGLLKASNGITTIDEVLREATNK